MTTTDKNKINRVRAKIFNMVSTGVVDEPINRFYDVISIVALILNLFAAFAITFDYMEEHPECSMVLHNQALNVYRS